MPALILAGCALINAPNYFPLGFRFFWTYSSTSTYALTGTTDTSYTQNDSIATEVLGAVNLGENGGWELRTQVWGHDPNCLSLGSCPQTTDPLTTDDTLYYVQTSDRVLRYASLTDSHPALVLELPPAQGQTWMCESTASKGTVTALVERKDTVTVPAATSTDVWRIKYTSTSGSTSTSWYANGIGVIKESTSSLSTTPTETTQVVTVTRLTSYQTQ